MNKLVLFAVLLFTAQMRAYSQPADFQPCTIEEVEGPVRCGSIEVFENREANKGRKIPINVVILGALDKNAEPDPLVVIQGGPGQAGTRLADFYAEAFAGVRKNRDIVLFDQRGTGKSNGLLCETNEPEKGPQGFLGDLLPIDLIRKCRTELEKRADLTQYTTQIAMDDLDEVRQKLGYEKINFYGTSYGTAAALVYMEKYPAHVRSAILKAVAPFQTMRVSVTTAKDASRALELLFQDCAADGECAKTFPNLKKEFDELFERIGKEPAVVEIKDPTSGKPAKVQLTREALGVTLRASLHAPQSASVLPLLIHLAHQGNYVPLTMLTLRVRQQFPKEIHFGMFLTVYCSEEMPYVTEELIKKETAGTFHGDYWAMQIFNACKEWPKGKAPDRTPKPVVSKAPVLLISGELDPVTPPRWGEEAAKSLPNSRHLVVKKGGHSFNLMMGCVDHIISDFINKGSTDELDFSCADKIKRPPFATDQSALK